MIGHVWHWIAAAAVAWDHALLVTAAAFSGAFFGQRVKLPLAWVRRTERIAQIEANRRVLRHVQEDHLLGRHPAITPPPVAQRTK